MHFLVKWKGYPTSDNSWEPRENLHADRLIAEYNKKKQRQAEPKKKGVKSRRARTEEKRPSFPQQHSPLHNHHIPSSHSKTMSAHSAPISSGAMDATQSPSTPVNLPNYRQFELIHCGQCRLPKEYSHTLWARGIVSGWTCRCDRTPSLPTTSPDLPLGQTAKDAQSVHDTGRLLAREDLTTGDNTR